MGNLEKKKSNRYENVLIPIDVTMYRIKYQIKQHVNLISRNNRSSAMEIILNIL